MAGRIGGISGKIICAFLIAVLGLTAITPQACEASAKKYMTVRQFIKEIERTVGPVEIKTGLKMSKKVTLGDAAILLVKADSTLNGRSVSKKDVEYILQNRIVIAGKASATRKNYLAKAYALGFVKGTSEGAYSGKRRLRINAKCTATVCRRMIKGLQDESSRYGLTEDYRMMRISQDNLPVLADMYEYILEDYPNEYYDAMLNFMTLQAVPGNSEQNELWAKRGCGVYLRKMTWDSAFKKLTFTDRSSFLMNYDSSDRLGIYSAYMLPCEYDAFAKAQNKASGYMGMPLNNKAKREMTDKAAEYAKYALNVDYRTIADDTRWQRYMLDNGISREAIDTYISECVKDELIMECDFVAADLAAVYYDRTPFTFKSSVGVTRTYAHYRIVSDNGKGFADGSLVIGNGQGRQCLRNTRISDDGLTYEWMNTSEWQDGYFDIGMDADGRINAAVFDVVRYKGIFTEAFGYPCETPCYYPGTLTVDGILATRMKNMTKERYLEEWGYLY